MFKKKVFCAWTGGKDTCLSLYHALKTYHVVCLVTVLTESADVPRTQGLSHMILRAQADALKIPLLIFNSSWDDYSKSYSDIIEHLREKYQLDGVVFADTESEEQRAWGTQVCQKNGMQAYYPLWHKKAETLLTEFLDLGFQAKIIAVNEKKLQRDYLGKNLTPELIEDFRQKNIDISGENSEYHTVVYDGPLFSHRVGLRDGDASCRHGFWLLDVHLTV